jgi:hypothetical protein
MPDLTASAFGPASENNWVPQPAHKIAQPKTTKRASHIMSAMRPKKCGVTVQRSGHSRHKSGYHGGSVSHNQERAIQTQKGKVRCRCATGPPRRSLLVATSGVPFLGSAGGTHIGFVSQNKRDPTGGVRMRTSLGGLLWVDPSGKRRTGNRLNVGGTASP